MKISATALYGLYARIWNLHRGFTMPVWGNLPTESKDGWVDMAAALENKYTAVQTAPGTPIPRFVPSAYANAANGAWPTKPPTAKGPDLETTALRALALFGRHKPTCSPLGECECGFAAVEDSLAEELARARGAGGAE